MKLASVSIDGGSCWGSVEERKTTEEARRAVPKERGQRDQRGRSGVPACRMTRGGVGPGCVYIHLYQSIKSKEAGLWADLDLHVADLGYDLGLVLVTPRDIPARS